MWLRTLKINPTDLYSHLFLQIVPKSGIALHSKLLRTVLNAGFVILNNVDSGTLLNRFNQDLMLVDMRLPVDLLNTASALLSCIFQLVLVASSAVYVLILIPVVGVVLALVQHFYLRTSKQLRILELEANSGLHTKLSEFYGGLVTIRAHSWQSTMIEEFHERLDESQEPLYLLYMVQTWLQLTLNLLVAGLAVVVVGVAVALRHTTSASRIGVAFLNVVSLGETLTNLMSAWTSMETSLGAITRIEAFERETVLEPIINSPLIVSDEWPATGHLKYDNVWASYSPHAEKPVWSLRSVTFEVNPGEKIAVCGRSGSGKSTLLLSLLALIETARGTIYLDGTDISRVQRPLLRSRLQVISQDPFIDGDTVRKGLDPEGKAHDEAINEILFDCSLLTKINASGGLTARVEDLNLSSGEVQLFVLARTLIEIGDKKGGVVVLDEATSR
jgi:ATP-binding cassette subfamily C (CFTR/MRP) protein 1